MKYIALESTDPYYNMAFEAWCLKHLPEGDSYFYLWRNAPAVIIGENQNALEEVNLEFLRSGGICLARRTTGGGAVYHDLNNLNYSFIGRDVSVRPIVDALIALGLPVELTGRNDIYIDGRKVSGYARRMENNRYLVHGTLLYDVDLQILQKALDTPSGKMALKGVKSVRSHVANLKDYLPQYPDVLAFRDALYGILAKDMSPFVPDEGQLAEIRQSRDSKFATAEWNLGRTAMNIRNKAQFDCGSVGVSLSLDDGRIADIRFGGDYLGRLSTDILQKRLTGISYEPESILSALKGIDVSDYFDSMSADQLVSLIISDTLG